MSTSMTTRFCSLFVLCFLCVFFFVFQSLCSVPCGCQATDILLLLLLFIIFLCLFSVIVAGQFCHGLSIVNLSAKSNLLQLHATINMYIARMKQVTDWNCINMFIAMHSEWIPICVHLFFPMFCRTEDKNKRTTFVWGPVNKKSVCLKSKKYTNEMRIFSFSSLFFFGTVGISVFVFDND